VRSLGRSTPASGSGARSFVSTPFRDRFVTGRSFSGWQAEDLEEPARISLRALGA